MAQLGPGGRLIAGVLFVAITLAYLPWMADAMLPKWILIWLAAVLAGSRLAFVRWTPDVLDYALLALVGWASLSLLWTPDQAGAAGGWLRAVPLVLLLIALRRIDAGLLGWPLVTAAALAVIGAGVFTERCTFAPAVTIPWPCYLAHGGFGNENFVTEWLVVAVPLLWISAPWLLPFVAAYLLFNGSVIEFGVLFVLALWWCRPISFYRRVALSWLIALAALAISVSTFAQISLGTRADLALNTFAGWLAAPLWGHGFASFQSAYPWFADSVRLFIPYSVEAHSLPGAAHNDWLQLAFELGLIGLGLAVFIVRLAWSRGELGWALILLAILMGGGFPLQHPAMALLSVVVLSESSRPRSSYLVLPAWLRARWECLRKLTWQLRGRTGTSSAAIGASKTSPSRFGTSIEPTN